MVESPVVVSAELAAVCDRLLSLVDSGVGLMVPADLQLDAENAVARGVAILANEPRPVAATRPPQRAIMARDLLTTTDLVRRALLARP